MRLKCVYKADGPGPSEQIVSITTSDKAEQIVLSKRKVAGGSIEVGDPLAEHNGMYLVELPRETASGRWRVWVPHSELIEASMMAAE
jgi:hypothetical protein